MNEHARVDRRGWALPTMLLCLALLGGCQSTRERMLAQGYPEPFAIGFEDGCSSGRQATGALGPFRKNVAVYLHDQQYATGWDDGFRQCHAGALHDFQDRVSADPRADRDWQHSKDQSWGRVLGHSAPKH